MNPGFIRLAQGEEYQDFNAPPENTRFKRWMLSYQTPHVALGIIGFVQADTTLTINRHRFDLEPGMYFAASGRLDLGGGCGIILECETYRPQFTIGGPIEPIGRLKYIDGCTDSLLLPPVKFGDPCFNALYFPPNINQTSHTHPSLRAGLVVSGRGECVTPAKTIPLEPDTAFVIETNWVHCFRTFADQGMVVVAYHPDSEFGPKDEDHPMINRTIVDGVPANQIEAIQTK
jgi:hypothetical protein